VPDASSPPLAAAGIVLRVATTADAALLTAFGRRLFEETFAPHNTPEDMAAYLAEAFGEAKQRAELLEPGATWWIAEDASGEPAGYVRLRMGAMHPHVQADRPAEVSRLYADRAHHGRGVGATLLARCITEARRRGADVLWLGVWEHNVRAIAFYEKNGFRVVGEQAFRLGRDVQRDLVMQLQL
jgi:ribosomal protein S18 acetylase RimI-like enzyme